MPYLKLFLGLLLMTAAISLAACSHPTSSTKADADTKRLTKSAMKKFRQLEDKYKVKLGIYGINTENNRVISYNSRERFAYASTYKAIAGGLLFKNLTNEQLNQKVSLKNEKIVPHSPITEKHTNEGMSVKTLIQAAMSYSDNTAGNLLLKQFGGPKGYQKELEKLGDKTTQADRYEPDLNKATPGDRRDTTTPHAMGKMLSYLGTKENLATDRASYFKQIIVGNTTGDKLIRAGVPKGYLIGDKTGAASYGTRHDIAIIYPKNNDTKPFFWVIFSKKANENDKHDDKLIAEAAKALSDYYSL